MRQYTQTPNMRYWMREDVYVYFGTIQLDKFGFFTYTHVSAVVYMCIMFITCLCWSSGPGWGRAGQQWRDPAGRPALPTCPIEHCCTPHHLKQIHIFCTYTINIYTCTLSRTLLYFTSPRILFFNLWYHLRLDLQMADIQLPWWPSFPPIFFFLIFCRCSLKLLLLI